MKIIHSSNVLESRTRTGAAKYWQNHIYQDGNRFFTGSSHWQVNKQGVKSKVTFAEPYECLPKNVGKVNETTAQDQAKSEFESNVKKYLDKGYNVMGAAPVATDPLPMLAHKFRDHAGKVKYPCYVQPKLDGMRMLSDGKRGWSRGNKEILPAVFAHLTSKLPEGIILDGELILPGNVPLQDTMSAAKKFRPGISNTLQYHVYDLVMPDKTYTERLEILRQLFADKTLSGNIVPVQTAFMANESAVLEIHKEFVGRGYEGTMIRAVDGKYEIGHRSYSLMKLKDWFDEEFEIIDVLEGGGSAKGQAIFKCALPQGGDFDSTPEANVEQRKAWFKDRKNLIGKYATVKHYGYTKDGKPCFNNTIAIREKGDF